jgi:hypothetical protein
MDMTIKRIAIGLVIAAAITLIFLYVYIPGISKTGEQVKITGPGEGMDGIVNGDEPRYEDPKDIPDCVYSTGSYVFGGKMTEGKAVIGYMYCQGNNTYHYEFVRESSTGETYWEKKEGGQ